ncbi:phosphatidylglycerol lysyltransferase domain-containing protein [Leptolyngbya sp. FACHB-261]|uniref:phosphatidylglycerol lysyltransferase domain-containing protein n=1 Tax=Leptolyngbya sp. FACHB-261 TaxID=2692806 RepID=UPI001F55A64E|nr:phosphatidylglycerol lysyltransferase domain-containing protein [Leptolyngbya sp. FACHB-261]
MLTPRTRLGLRLTALLTGLVGVVNLFSAATPNLHNRSEWLREFLPFEVRAGGHLFAAITGFVLLTLATNILRRKRVAWWLAVVLLVVSIVSHLLKGLDYEESLLSTVLLIQLLLLRQVFTARSDRPSVAQGIRTVIGALLFTLAYGTAGFYFLDNHYKVNFGLQAAIVQTIAMFFTDDSGGLVPTTRFGQFFADSIYAIGGVTFLYVLVMLLRPVLWRDVVSLGERQQAQAIVEQSRPSSLARMTLFEDKTYYFSPAGHSLIAYVPKGRGAIALGDPIGPEEDRRETIIGFQQFCERNDWYPAFYQTLPDDLDLYRELGFQTLQIGEEAVVNLKEFTLEGKAGKGLRTPLNRLKKLGHEIKFHEPPISDALLSRLSLEGLVTRRKPPKLKES